MVYSAKGLKTGCLGVCRIDRAGDRDRLLKGFNGFVEPSQPLLDMAPSRENERFEVSVAAVVREGTCGDQQLLRYMQLSECQVG